MEERYILVIADGSNEMEVALEYACARSKKTDRKISGGQAVVESFKFNGEKKVIG